MTEFKPRKLYPSNILPLANIATTLLAIPQTCKDLLGYKICWQFQPYKFFAEILLQCMPWLAVLLFNYS